MQVDCTRKLSSHDSFVCISCSAPSTSSISCSSLSKLPSGTPFGSARKPCQEACMRDWTTSSKVAHFPISSSSTPSTLNGCSVVLRISAFAEKPAGFRSHPVMHPSPAAVLPYLQSADRYRSFCCTVFLTHRTHGLRRCTAASHFWAICFALSAFPPSASPPALILLSR